MRERQGDQEVGEDVEGAEGKRAPRNKYMNRGGRRVMSRRMKHTRSKTHQGCEKPVGATRSSENFGLHHLGFFGALACLWVARVCVRQRSCECGLQMGVVYDRCHIIAVSKVWFAS